MLIGNTVTNNATITTNGGTLSSTERSTSTAGSSSSGSAPRFGLNPVTLGVPPSSSTNLAPQFTSEQILEINSRNNSQFVSSFF